jgi:hypothetical protein
MLQGLPLLSRSTHIYIASLLHSYSSNSVLHLLSPTIRDKGRTTNIVYVPSIFERHSAFQKDPWMRKALSN